MSKPAFKQFPQLSKLHKLRAVSNIASEQEHAINKSDCYFQKDASMMQHTGW